MAKFFISTRHMYQLGRRDMEDLLGREHDHEVGLLMNQVHDLTDQAQDLRRRMNQAEARLYAAERELRLNGGA